MAVMGKIKPTEVKVLCVSTAAKKKCCLPFHRNIDPIQRFTVVQKIPVDKHSEKVNAISCKLCN